MGKEFEKKIDTCMYITESFCIHLKLTQHCYSTTFQYKIKIKKESPRNLLKNVPLISIHTRVFDPKFSALK